MILKPSKCYPNYKGIVLVLSLVTLCGQGSGKALPCQPKNYGQGSVVCVCNATYCDTVESNEPLPHTKYAVYTSTKSGLRLQKSVHDFSSTAKSIGAATYTINRNTKYQNIIGFGGAFTDSAIINIASLSFRAQEKLFASYFSPDGIEYTLGRVPMASTDFSTHIYSYDDTADDFQLHNFSLPVEDLKGKIPAIQKAISLGQRKLQLFASPWSAPAWMKTNKNMTGKGTLIGEPGGKYYKTWANYYVRFLQEYAKHNISFWGITAQNEPTTGMLKGYPFQTMGFTAEMQRDFVARDLGPTLRRHGFGHVNIMILDDQRLLLPHWAITVLSSPEAAQYVSGIGVHWYMDIYTPTFALDKTHQSFPDKFILYTEACEGKNPWDTPDHIVSLGDWLRFETYAYNIMQDLQHWVSGWTDWNMALNLDGGPTWVPNPVESPIIVNAEHDEFYKQPLYYTLGHFSKFIPNGSVRIGLDLDGTTALDAIAFSTPDGAIVFIVRNDQNEAIQFSVTDDSVGRINAVSPPRSLQTFCWWS